jgi:O-antigen ligase
MLLFCIISILKLKKIKVNTVIKIFALFIAYAFLSLLITQVGFAAYTMFGKMLVMLLLLMIFNNSGIELKKVLKLITISGLISIFVFNAIYYFVLGNSIIENSARGIRLVGGASLPTAYALFTGMCFISSLLMYRFEKKLRYFFLAILFMLYSIVTYTRIVWVGLLAVILLYMLLEKKWIKLALICIFVFIVSLSSLTHYFLLDNISMAPGKERLEVISQGRSVIWETFYNKFLEHPVFGLGFEYTTTHSKDLTGIISNHSDPLRILFDLGIVGFLLYSSFVLALVIHLYRRGYPRNYIFLFFAFYFITSLTGNIFNYIQLIGFQAFTLFGMALNKNENLADQL